MPRNVVIFERLMYAVIGLAACLALLETAVVASVAGAGAMVGLIGASLVLVIWGLLVWLTARRRKNWARWVLLIVAVVAFFVAYPQLSKEFQANALLGYVRAAGFLMEAMAFWFVFTGDAKDWFRKPMAAEPVA